MWNYEKKLQFPVNIKHADARTAKIVMSQYGGPDGEISASLRYLSQRYTMPNGRLIGLLTDIGISCLKCSHTSQAVFVRSSVPHSTCVGVK